MEFSRQEYWSGLPFPSPGDLPDPGIKAGPPALQPEKSSQIPMDSEKYMVGILLILDMSLDFMVDSSI